MTLQMSYPAHMTVADSQKQIEMQRLQTEHLKRQQQEHIMQHNIQELQAQMTKSQLGMSGMFLPFFEQLRGLPVQSPMPLPPATSTATTGNKHINSIANVRGSVIIDVCHPVFRSLATRQFDSIHPPLVARSVCLSVTSCSF